MSIQSIDFPIQTKQNMINKIEYGEIISPPALVHEMLDMLPSSAFSDPSSRWLDPGAGTGHFSVVLYHRLMEGLEKHFPKKNERHHHIIRNMIYMIEIQHTNIEILQSIFGTEANIIEENYLLEKDMEKYNYIIGNPPYNANGVKKVPTNHSLKKKLDGQTIWIDFVKKSLSLLHDNGYLCFIIPSIWMKPDKAKVYDLLTSFNIDKIKCYSNSETNKIFKGEAQTPTCCITLCKRPSTGQILLYDQDRIRYIPYMLEDRKPIPIFGASIINKLKPYVDAVGPIKVYKTNMPPSHATLSSVPSNKYTYSNIKTCLLNITQPKLVVNYSDRKLSYAGMVKLIMAHKMYGFPYLDTEGLYGISNRDNYVIIDRSIEDLERLRAFLSTKTALYLFETTRYRMKYLERYIFELIPDITKLTDFPTIINDESIAEYFKFDLLDQKYIANLHQKNYTFTPVI